MNTLSIIILQHNTPEHVNKALKTLKKGWLPEKTEIVVINNGGHNANDKIDEDAKSGLKIQFLDVPNEGFPKGNNIGLNASNAKYYAFVNPDIVVEEDTMKILLEYLENHQKVGIVAPQLHYPDGTIQDNYRVFPNFTDLIIKRTSFLRKRFPDRMRRYLMWDKDPNVNEPVDWVTGACIMMRRECLEMVGNHDERYFLFMSDVVLCREVWEKGFEVHFVGQARALHNDERLSGGGLKDIFRKKTLRIHIKDAVRYYLHYFGKKLPQDSPTLSQLQFQDRLLKAHQLSKSFLKRVNKKLQKDNPVVSVYKGDIVGHKSYSQPIVFFDTGVVGVVRNEQGQIGLMNIWRHTPLSFEKKNTFPIFPDVSHLGQWSLECTRGGMEKTDISPEESIKRELVEEIGLTEKHIRKITPLGRVVGNTAIDVYSHMIFEILISSDYQFSTNEKIETIKSFEFYEPSEIFELIKSNKLFCGISQGAILQTLSKEKVS